MAQGTKITFSEAELEAITHPDFFYTKYAAMQKVMELLGETERMIRQVLLSHPHFGLHTDIQSPKIFRGENYRQLPYMVLDFPRRFNTETVFSFRSMFWWGKEFSFTLHLQGEAFQHFRKTIEEKIRILAGNNFYFCVHASPWQYYFEQDNYMLLDELLEGDGLNAAMQTATFFKLSRKIPVTDFENVPQYAAETLSLVLKILE